MLASLGPEAIVLLIIAAILIFGARRLPEIGKGMGKGIKEFREGLKGDEAKQPPAEGDREEPPTPGSGSDH